MLILLCRLSVTTPEYQTMTPEELKKKAYYIRYLILEAIVAAGKGHIGGAFSCTDILTTLYYGNIMRYDANKPNWDDRDRLLLSKGHSGVALFAVLADLGFFDLNELQTFCQDNSRLGGHPDRLIPGIEADTGSLGHGLGIGIGMALRAKMDKKDYLTFVLLGDGECYEGSIWEALLFAGHHKLNNIVAIIDRNQQCVLDYTEDCVRLDPLDLKLQAFGWDVETIDGHSFAELLRIFSNINKRLAKKPIAIIANTVKGKGVSYMEGQLKWHHGLPDKNEYRIAVKELTGKS